MLREPPALDGGGAPVPVTPGQLLHVAARLLRQFPGGGFGQKPVEFAGGGHRGRVRFHRGERLIQKVEFGRGAEAILGNQPEAGLFVELLPEHLRDLREERGVAPELFRLRRACEFAPEEFHQLVRGGDRLVGRESDLLHLAPEPQIEGVPEHAAQLPLSQSGIFREAAEVIRQFVGPRVVFLPEPEVEKFQLVAVPPVVLAGQFLLLQRLSIPGFILPAGVLQNELFQLRMPVQLRFVPQREILGEEIAERFPEPRPLLRSHLPEFRQVFGANFDQRFVVPAAAQCADDLVAEILLPAGGDPELELPLRLRIELEEEIASGTEGQVKLLRRRERPALFQNPEQIDFPRGIGVEHQRREELLPQFILQLLRQWRRPRRDDREAEPFEHGALKGIPVGDAPRGFHEEVLQAFPPLRRLLRREAPGFVDGFGTEGVEPAVKRADLFGRPVFRGEIQRGGQQFPRQLEVVADLFLQENGRRGKGDLPLRGRLQGGLQQDGSGDLLRLQRFVEHRGELLLRNGQQSAGEGGAGGELLRRTGGTLPQPGDERFHLRKVPGPEQIVAEELQNDVRRGNRGRAQIELPDVVEQLFLRGRAPFRPEETEFRLERRRMKLRIAPAVIAQRPGERTPSFRRARLLLPRNQSKLLLRIDRYQELFPVFLLIALLKQIHQCLKGAELHRPVPVLLQGQFHDRHGGGELRHLRHPGGKREAGELPQNAVVRPRGVGTVLRLKQEEPVTEIGVLRRLLQQRFVQCGGFRVPVEHGFCQFRRVAALLPAPACRESPEELLQHRLVAGVVRGEAQFRQR